MFQSATVCIVELVWLWCGFLLSVSYKSNLRATMMTPVYETPVDTAEQVLALGLPVMAVQATVCEQALRDSNKPVYRLVECIVVA
jgi:hypothetical protein